VTVIHKQNIMLITIIGAGAGVSQSVAELFGHKGFKVALISRNEEKLKTQIEKLNTAGIDTVYAVGDAGDERSLINAIEKIHSEYGLSDVVLYNAYTPNMKGLAAETWESIKIQMDTNVGGAFQILKHLLPKFKERNSGKLFFTGGGLSMQPMPRILALGMGKAALRNMIQAVSAETRNTHVHIATVTICGYVKQEDPKNSPALIAEQFGKLYDQAPGSYETEVIY
jgi:NADP-dependent 3-hydroxy acid dehydrogenase YdfG